jgi:Flp pilus assembly pilin Flp
MIDRLNGLFIDLTVYAPERARNRLKSLRSQGGQAFVEYALLLTVVAIAVALITEWSNFVDAITTALQKIENVIKNPSPSSTTP